METSSTSSQRLRLGLWVLSVLPVLSFANFFWQNAPQTVARDAALIERVITTPAADWGVYGETRFSTLRAFLPARGVVGLVSDEEDSLFQARLFSAQHVLAPLVIRPDAKAEKVLCLFRNARRLRDAQKRKFLSQWIELDSKKRELTGGLYGPVARRFRATTPLLLERDFGNGLLLFRNSSENRSTP